MIKDLPIGISILFLITCVVVIVFFYVSNGKPKKLTAFVILWSIVHSVLAYKGFYHDTNSIPPRFALVLIPTSLFVVYGLLSKQRDWVKKNRSTRLSTFLHSIRLPVEIVLLQLYLYKMVPELMTFEGLNFDIIIGMTAPIIGILFLKNKISKKALLVWNVFGLLLVILILVMGLLSAELPFQQFGFEQPNRAVTYFPFILLPATIVPLVVWTHLSDIFKLRRELKLSQ